MNKTFTCAAVFYFAESHFLELFLLPHCNFKMYNHLKKDLNEQLDKCETVLHDICNLKV